jgi:hypothetical protein
MKYGYARTSTDDPRAGDPEPCKLWKMPKRNFTVVAHLPAAVDITKRTSQNSLTIEIKDGSTKIGTLVVGRGTVEWWPESNRVNAHRANWYNFAEMMTTLPKKRSTRKPN